MCKGERIPEKIGGKRKLEKITFVGFNTCCSNQDTTVLTERQVDQWNNIKYRNRHVVVRPVAFLTKLQSNSMKKAYSFNIFC